MALCTEASVSKNYTTYPGIKEDVQKYNLLKMDVPLTLLFTATKKSPKFSFIISRVRPIQSTALEMHMYKHLTSVWLKAPTNMLPNKYIIKTNVFAINFNVDLWKLPTVSANSEI